MAQPTTDNPNVEILEIVGPSMVKITMCINDWGFFLDRLKAARVGHPCTFIKHGEKTVTVKITSNPQDIIQLKEDYNVRNTDQQPSGGS